MVNNTDGNTYAINRNLEEREQYDMEIETLQHIVDMQDEIDTLQDVVDRLEKQQADLLRILKRAQLNVPEAYRSWHHVAAVAIAECEADQ